MRDRTLALALALTLASGGAVGRADGAPTVQADAVDPLLEEAIAWYTGTIGQVDDARAQELLREAVADDDPISVMWLARCYSRGRMFFEQDRELALDLALSVIDTVLAFAEDDVAEAAFLMGTAYAEGLGPEVDPIMAIAWYHRAADLGNVLAMHNLGNAYFDGNGVVQDDSMAVYWWRQAAQRGDAIPQQRLGMMYEQGRGVEQDIDVARRWYREAAGRGNSEAMDALQRLDGADDGVR